MKVDSLRFEFVLVGLATLLSLHLLLRDEPLQSLDVLRQAGQLSPGGALLALGLLLAASFIIGILAVQVTFYIPTRRLIANVRDARLEELRDYALSPVLDAPDDADFRVLLQCAFAPDVGEERQEALLASRGRTAGRRVASPGRLGALIRRQLHRAWLPLSRSGATVADGGLAGDALTQRLQRLKEHKTTATSLALTIGRMEAPGNVTREYEYRRSNRQVFIGCLPALFLAGCAVGRQNVPDRPVWQQVLIAVAAAVGTVVAMGVAVHAAHYQEKVAQAMLLDVAFLTAMRPGRTAVKEQDESPKATE